MNKLSKYFLIIVYFLGLIISFLILSPVWTGLLRPKLFVCTDPIPFLGFFPPFVHPNTPDYYLVSPVAVYLLWFSFVITLFLLPFYLSAAIRRKLAL